MSDDDMVSRKDVLNMAYLSVFVDNDGNEVDEPRYVIDAFDVERLPAAPQEMTAREYHNIANRMSATDIRAFKLWWDMMRWLDFKALTFAQNWAREHPKEVEENE